MSLTRLKIISNIFFWIPRHFAHQLASDTTRPTRFVINLNYNFSIEVQEFSIDSSRSKKAGLIGEGRGGEGERSVE